MKCLERAGWSGHRDELRIFSLAFLGLSLKGASFQSFMSEITWSLQRPRHFMSGFIRLRAKLQFTNPRYCRSALYSGPVKVKKVQTCQTFSNFSELSNFQPF